MKLTNLNHVDVWVRAFKTGLVAFLAAWALSGNSLSKDAVVSAGSAAGTAVLNYFLQLVRS
jgi:uncharacterized membrane protein YgaE (UPF0421/DUF939 family)